MGILCCLGEYKSMGGLLLILLGSLALLLKISKKKPIDSETKKLLTTADDIPAECRATIAALLGAEVSNDEATCAEQMRDLLKSGALPYSSLASNPELLLSMSKHAGDSQTYGALWTRFTVQYNLFAGSIVALGSQEQREKLFRTQSNGELGCFAFTEAGAGVLSGAAFEATAVFDPATQEFTIHCPTPSSKKRWISQGLFAEHAVISANLMVQVNGAPKSLGPHLFFTRIQNRDPVTGVLTPVPGVQLSSVGVKTALVGLDNAIIEFSHFKVPRTALLDRFSSMTATGEYATAFPKGVTRMLDLLITRLLTGRIVLSEYTVCTVLKVFRHNWTYCCNRDLWKSAKQAKATKMSELPLIEAAFVDYGRCLGVVKAFIAQSRDKVVQSIKQDKFLPDVVEATCVSKFVGTGFSVDAISAIRKLMGSQALFEDSWLGESSFVCNATCAAEGDNTIMELKIVQDIFRGRTSLLPWSLLLRSMGHALGRRVVWAYLSKVAYAFWLREAALKEGQLLKDLAWCRAHMLIMDSWLKGKNDPDWLESYGRILVKFPMPTQC